MRPIVRAACRFKGRVRSSSERPEAAATAALAVARAVVEGEEAMAVAVMQSQMLVRIRGLPGLWRALRVWAREFWEGGIVQCNSGYVERLVEIEGYVCVVSHWSPRALSIWIYKDRGLFRRTYGSALNEGQASMLWNLNCTGKGVMYDQMRVSLY